MLPKLENELDLDKDELELKGEAAELEPFFSRGDPIPGAASCTEHGLSGRFRR
jgi:hypothetical protein